MPPTVLTKTVSWSVSDMHHCLSGCVWHTGRRGRAAVATVEGARAFPQRMDGQMDRWYDWIFDYWTVTIFLPTVLLLLAALAIITRISDKRAGH
jgi:hypothetical protein